MTSGRRLDAVAVDRSLRRLAARSGPPWLHLEVARRLAERLAPIRLEPQRILDWGAGIGAGETLLRERYPKARIVAVEADATWLRRLASSARPGWWQRFGAARAEAYVAADDDASIGRAQLVWANMLLHGVVDPTALFERWHRLLDVDGVLVLSCLGPATLRLLREVYEAMGWGASTPGFIDMHDIGDMLVGAGFAGPVLDQETLSVSWSNVETLLDELRQLGGNAAPDRCPGMRTPRWRQRLVDALGQRASADGRITLGFEIAYGHAFKPPTRARPGEPVSVSLDDMRAMVRRPPNPR